MDFYNFAIKKSDLVESLKIKNETLRVVKLFENCFFKLFWLAYFDQKVQVVKLSNYKILIQFIHCYL